LWKPDFGPSTCLSRFRNPLSLASRQATCRERKPRRQCCECSAKKHSESQSSTNPTTDLALRRLDVVSELLRSIIHKPLDIFLVHFSMVADDGFKLGFAIMKILDSAGKLRFLLAVSQYRRHDINEVKEECVSCLLQLLDLISRLLHRRYISTISPWENLR
jgi:hypothetical protein